MANGKSNPFDGIFRTLNWRAQPLDAALASTGTRTSAPFISNVTATTPIVVDATGGNANIRFIAADALGVPDTTNLVRVTFSAATSTCALGTLTSGTVITSEPGLGNDSLALTILPGTGGLVSFIAGFGGAVTGKVAIQVRDVIAGVSLTVSA